MMAEALYDRVTATHAVAGLRDDLAKLRSIAANTSTNGGQRAYEAAAQHVMRAIIEIERMQRSIPR